jgi:hypothetical protein
VHDGGLNAPAVWAVSVFEFLVEAFGLERVSLQYKRIINSRIKNLAQRTFVQRQHTRLGGGVVHKAATGEVTRHTCNADDVALLRIQHCREELLDGDPVAEEIDTEKLLEVFFRCVEDSMGRCDACVVDQD